MNHTPIFWILFVGVLAPLLGELPLGFRIPVVVIEVLLGIAIGPHALGLVPFEGFVPIMFTIGMATTLFMAGLELDFGEIKGRPLSLAVGGWAISVLVSAALVAVLHLIPQVDAPLMLALALCTTGLGILVPIFRDSGLLGTPFGRFMLAAGTMGELAPIVAMSILLSQHYSGWQEAGFLLIFLVIIAAAVAVGVRARPPRLLALLARHMHRSTQMPVRAAMLLVTAMLLMAERFGFEGIFGAFAAGMVLGQMTRGPAGRPLREKLETICFGWFYPFFFVGIGIKFDITALGHDVETTLLVPLFLALFLIIRGAPVLLYREQLAKAHRLPFVLSSAVPSLSIIVVITDIGTRRLSMTHDVAAALVGAALLSVLMFPTLAGALLTGRKPVDTG